MILAPAVLALVPLQETALELVERVTDDIRAARVLETVEGLALFGTRHTASSTDSEERGIGAARRYLLSELEAYGGRLVAAFDPHPVTLRGGGEVEVVNVVGYLPGAMPAAAARHYYVVGHYDSRASNGGDAQSDAPGANDDASGVAVVMELARVLANERLDASIVFLATAGEEQGLLGATAHVETVLADDAPGGARDIRGVLNNDIVGDPNGPSYADGTPRVARDVIRVFSEGIPSGLSESEVANVRRLSSENDSPSRQLARHIADVAEHHSLAVRPRLIQRPDRFLRGGDHTPFNRRGIPAVRFTEVFENYAHQHQDVREEDGVIFGDLPEFVDGDYLADVARLNAAALIHLANAPSSPPNTRVIVSSLTIDTTLRWDASPEPDVAGYEVLWRETTDATWTHALDVGEALEATLELSKDNWAFGVRAYDAGGYRSPVSFPAIGR